MDMELFDASHYQAPRHQNAIDVLLARLKLFQRLCFGELKCPMKSLTA